ncbi:MAG TPA: tetratricopeptide repeat protein [Stellaceae bacterium]|nr:tetratricopeptide repeat protein [Stellaceae bacterium]
MSELPAGGWTFANPGAYRRAVDELEQAGQKAEAAALLAEAERQFPDDPLIYIRRTYAIMADDPETAAGRWSTSRARFPQYMDGWVHGALLLENFGRRQAASILLDDAVRRFPADVRVLTVRAYFAQRQDNWAEADAFWQMILQENPENEEAIKGRENALRMRK